MKNRLQQFLACFILCIAPLLMGGQWEDGIPLNTPRTGAASAVFGDYIYVMGGKSLNGTILNTVERFHPDSGQWEFVASFNTPRMGAAAIVFGDSIFLAGGRANLSDDAIKEVEVYVPAQDMWHSAQDMRREREGHTLAFFNNRIHAIGGQKNQNDLEEEIEYYDVQDDDWKQVPFDIAEEKVAFFSGVVRDTFYMCGGFYYGPTKNSFIKPPLTLNWISGPDMAGPRANGASALLGDRLFMIGGETQSGITDSVEIFDINSYYIMPGQNLPIARSGMTAVTLNDTIYVVGGETAQSGGQPTTLVQTYYEITGISTFDDPDQIIESTHLVGYPNPFNGRINLEFRLPGSGSTELTIIDIQGRNINTIVRENLIEGTHLVSWDGKDFQNRQVASGIYFAILRGNSFYKTFKMIYVK